MFAILSLLLSAISPLLPQLVLLNTLGPVALSWIIGFLSWDIPNARLFNIFQAGFVLTMAVIEGIRVNPRYPSSTSPTVLEGVAKYLSIICFIIQCTRLTNYCAALSKKEWFLNEFGKAD